jgi:hypothetical protein
MLKTLQRVVNIFWVFITTKTIMLSITPKTNVKILRCFILTLPMNITNRQVENKTAAVEKFSGAIKAQVSDT